MINSVILKPQEEKTYTVVFYIKAMDYDQTNEDANKNFGAIIRVDSLTTGAYKHITVGKTCYEFDELDDGTLKLTKFNGIDANGNADSTCGVTKSEDGFYTIIVPSTIGETKVSTLGSTLFMGVDLSTFQMNNYSKIENIIIEEGITKTEGGEMVGTFAGVGATSIALDDSGIPSATYYDRKISISLPSTLTNVGNYTFALSGISDYKFNLDENNTSNLETIGIGAFIGTNITDLTLPSGIKTISENAFQVSNITNLTISGDIEVIGPGAFSATIDNLVLKEGLTKIHDYMFDDVTITNTENKPLIIPASVTTIGNYAFSDTNNDKQITKLIFTDTEENPSQLESIGERAFYNLSLLYESADDPLVIPFRKLQSIGKDAFKWDSSYKGNLAFIKYLGTNEEILNNNSSTNSPWYQSTSMADLKTTLLTE